MVAGGDHRRQRHPGGAHQEPMVIGVRTKSVRWREISVWAECDFSSWWHKIYNSTLLIPARPRSGVAKFSVQFSSVQFDLVP
jgi:hypothetical protein